MSSTSSSPPLTPFTEGIRALLLLREEVMWRQFVLDSTLQSELGGAVMVSELLWKQRFLRDVEVQNGDYRSAALAQLTIDARRVRESDPLANLRSGGDDLKQLIDQVEEQIHEVFTIGSQACTRLSHSQRMVLSTYFDVYLRIRDDSLRRYKMLQDDIELIEEPIRSLSVPETYLRAFLEPLHRRSATRMSSVHGAVDIYTEELIILLKERKELVEDAWTNYCAALMTWNEFVSDLDQEASMRRMEGAITRLRAQERKQAQLVDTIKAFRSVAVQMPSVLKSSAGSEIDVGLLIGTWKRYEELERDIAELWKVLLRMRRDISQFRALMRLVTEDG